MNYFGYLPSAIEVSSAAMGNILYELSGTYGYYNMVLDVAERRPIRIYGISVICRRDASRQ